MLRSRRLATHKASVSGQAASRRHSRPFTAKVYASFDEVLAPILVGVGAVAGAFVGARLTSSSYEQQSKKKVQLQDTVKPAVQQKKKQKQQQEQAQQQQQQQQQEQSKEVEKLVGLVQKQSQQLAQLERNKQQLQQAAKKQRKALDKLQYQLDNAEQELSTARSQHAAAAVELLQVRGELDQATKQVQLLKEKQAQLAGAYNGTNSRYGQEDAQEESAAALQDGHRLRIAFVGGKELKESHKALLPPNSDVRHFGSSRDMGEGEIKRLEACIKAGSIDQVYMLTRWNGHGITKRVMQLCKPLKIPVRTLSVQQVTKMKNTAATASGSDASDDEASS